MNDIQQTPSVSRPRWDGSRVLFDIEHDGQLVACAISRGALQDMSAHRCFKAADLLKCFDEARTRIEEIAVAKFRADGESVSGVISVWADDVDDETPEAAKPSGN
ncbi:MAG: DUF1488 family protein [Acetobacteraceae bacterium]